MKMPVVVLFKVREKVIAYSPRYFTFHETEFDLHQPIKLIYEGQMDIVFGEELTSLNDEVAVKFNEKMEVFDPKQIENMYVNSTNVCAGKCTYCYAEDVMINSNVVTFDDFMEMVEKTDSVNTIKEVNVLGGEPILNFTLIERLLLETDYKVSISTGLFLKDKLFDRFMEIGLAHNERMSVQCSIDPTNKYRPGKNGGQAIYDRTERILEEFIYTQLRCTICTGDIDYRKLRNDYEKKLNKEVFTTFELVSTPELWVSPSEWYKLLSMLIIDAHEFMDGERTELPLSIVEVSDNLLEQWEAGHSNFYVALGCSMYSGDAPVLTPDTIINKEFQRCTQPQDREAINKPFTIPQGCTRCEILRYCGVSCPAEAGVASFCGTQLLKHLVSVYLFLWRNEKWN